MIILDFEHYFFQHQSPSFYLFGSKKVFFLLGLSFGRLTSGLGLSEPISRRSCNDFQSATLFLWGQRRWVAQLEERSLATPEIHDSNHISGKILSTNCTIKNRKDKNKDKRDWEWTSFKKSVIYFSFWCCWKNHWSRILGQWLFQPHIAPCSRSKVSFISC